MSYVQWTGKIDPQAPLLVIGAGRSGSSLLSRMLGAHPDMCFDDEKDFLAVKMWQVVWENCRPRRVGTMEPANKEEQESILKRRLAPLVARALVDVLGIDTECKNWGYKELWNGSATHRYSWDTYDLLFPRATWLHLIRHPLEFAASCASWNRDELTESYLDDRLADWVAIVEYSRLRQSCGRYYEIRYEDLLVRPRVCLEPVLAGVGLPWSSACELPLKHRIMASQRQPEKEQAILKRFRRSRLLAQTTASLGYEL
jgi:hypothetical protein